MILKGGNNPYRPEIPKGTNDDEMNHGVVELMKECWNESPDQRPEFSKIITNLKAINKGK